MCVMCPFLINTSWGRSYESSPEHHDAHDPHRWDSGRGRKTCCKKTYGRKFENYFPLFRASSFQLVVVSMHLCTAGRVVWSTVSTIGRPRKWWGPECVDMQRGRYWACRFARLSNNFWKSIRRRHTPIHRLFVRFSTFASFACACDGGEDLRKGSRTNNTWKCLCVCTKKRMIWYDREIDTNRFLPVNVADLDQFRKRVFSYFRKRLPAS